MTRFYSGIAILALVAACGDGSPFNTVEDGDDKTPGSAYLDEEGTFLTLNNIAYDPGSDTLTINNIPFDDPENAYKRIQTETFANGFNAYESDPAPGSNEIQYFAVFRRSDSGQSQVAAAGTTAYVQFGYGGAGAQRLGANPTLPTTGIYSYNGEYAAVRTTLDAGPGGSNLAEFVTGDVTMRVDYGDFDDTGTVGGTVGNRRLYDTTGTQIGTLDGFISMQDSTIDFETQTIVSATVTEFVGGTATRSGSWEGVFAGPNGEEIAGVLFVEGDDVREVGGFVTTQ